MYIKFGKESSDIIAHKKSFFEENEKCKSDYDSIAIELKKCVVRHNCKICKTELTDAITFSSHGLNYFICPNCEHVNSQFVESSEFLNSIYKESNYNLMYTEDTKKKYEQRMQDIYVPKVAFLKEYLQESGEDKKVRLLDVGAGSGYFVAACNKMGIECKGIEISKKQVELANVMGISNVDLVDENSFLDEILRTDSNVVSAIGVIEHLLDPLSFFEAVSNNKNIKYIYFMVPIWGFSNILEILNPAVFNRHLGGAHTHVFSNKSIDYLCTKYGFDIDGKWQFGTDVVDLYRICMVELEKKGCNIEKYWKDKFLESIDDMQLILDKNNFCSEAHFILKRKDDYK